KANAFLAEGRTPDQQSVFAHVQRLGRLRSQLESLRRGSQIDLLAAEQQYVYARVTGHDSVIVAINNDSKPAVVELDVGPAKIATGVTLTDRLGVAADFRLEGTRAKVSIPARSAAVFVRK